MCSETRAFRARLVPMVARDRPVVLDLPVYLVHLELPAHPEQQEFPAQMVCRELRVSVALRETEVIRETRGLRAEWVRLVRQGWTVMRE